MCFQRFSICDVSALCYCCIMYIYNIFFFHYYPSAVWIRVTLVNVRCSYYAHLYSVWVPHNCKLIFDGQFASSSVSSTLHHIPEHYILTSGMNRNSWQCFSRTRCDVDEHEASCSVALVDPCLWMFDLFAVPRNEKNRFKSTCHIMHIHLLSPGENKNRNRPEWKWKYVHICVLCNIYTYMCHTYSYTKKWKYEMKGDTLFRFADKHMWMDAYIYIEILYKNMLRACVCLLDNRRTFTCQAASAHYHQTQHRHIYHGLRP